MKITWWAMFKTYLATRMPSENSRFRGFLPLIVFYTAPLYRFGSECPEKTQKISSADSRLDMWADCKLARFVFAYCNQGFGSKSRAVISRPMKALYSYFDLPLGESPRYSLVVDRWVHRGPHYQRPQVSSRQNAPHQDALAVYAKLRFLRARSGNL